MSAGCVYVAGTFSHAALNGVLVPVPVGHAQAGAVRSAPASAVPALDPPDVLVEAQRLIQRAAGVRFRTIADPTLDIEVDIEPGDGLGVDRADGRAAERPATACGVQGDCVRAPVAVADRGVVTDRCGVRDR